MVSSVSYTITVLRRVQKTIESDLVNGIRQGYDNEAAVEAFNRAELVLARMCDSFTAALEAEQERGWRLVGIPT